MIPILEDFFGPMKMIMRLTMKFVVWIKHFYRRHHHRHKTNREEEMITMTQRWITNERRKKNVEILSGRSEKKANGVNVFQRYLHGIPSRWTIDNQCSSIVYIVLFFIRRRRLLPSSSPILLLTWWSRWAISARPTI